MNLGMPTCMWFLTDNVGGEQDVIENYENLKHNQSFWHPVAQTVDFHVCLFAFTFHRSKLCYKNLKDIEIVILF